MKKRLLSAVTALALCLSLMPAPALAAEPESAPVFLETEAGEVYTPDDSIQPEDIRGLDNDELFDQYLNSLISGESEIAPLADYGSVKLLGADSEIYELLKAKIQKVANGTETSTQKWVIKTPAFREGDSLPVGSVEIGTITKGDWTNKSEIPGTSEEALKTAMQDILSGEINVKNIVDCLLVDCPYELYWFDKKSGYLSGNGARYAPNSATGNVDVGGLRVPYLTFSMKVAKAYQKDGEYTVNNDKVNTAKTAIQNAKDFANSLTETDPVELMTAFKNKICELVSYNHDSAGQVNPDYGDPWQLIYVFDNDPNTNVVCEGYSKAFQYLCDLKGLTCYTVTGEMSGGTGAGRHMWNIVSLNGGNYLVDVTNSDESSVGQSGGLFLTLPKSGTWETEYTFAAGGSGGAVAQDIIYAYDADLRDFYGESVLELASGEISSKPQAAATLETMTISHGGSDAPTEIKPDADGIYQLTYGATFQVKASDLTAAADSDQAQAVNVSVEPGKFCMFLKKDGQLTEIPCTVGEPGTANAAAAGYDTTAKAIDANSTQTLVLVYGGDETYAPSVISEFEININPLEVAATLSDNGALSVIYNGTQDFAVPSDQLSKIILANNSEPVAGEKLTINSADIRTSGVNCGSYPNSPLVVTLADGTDKDTGKACGLNQYYSVAGGVNVSVEKCTLKANYVTAPLTEQIKGETVPVTISVAGIPENGCDPQFELAAAATNEQAAGKTVSVGFTKTADGNYTCELPTESFDVGDVVTLSVVSKNGNYAIENALSHSLTILDKPDAVATVTADKTELIYGDTLTVHVSDIHAADVGNELRALNKGTLYLYDNTAEKHLLAEATVDASGSASLVYDTKRKILEPSSADESPSKILTVRYGGDADLKESVLGTVEVMLKRKPVSLGNLTSVYNGQIYQQENLCLLYTSIRSTCLSCSLPLSII